MKEFFSTLGKALMVAVAITVITYFVVAFVNGSFSMTYDVRGALALMFCVVTMFTFVIVLNNDN